MAQLMDAYISEDDLAKELDLSIWALRAWARKGFGPTRHKILRRVYYKIVEVRLFLNEQLDGS